MELNSYPEIGSKRDYESDDLLTSGIEVKLQM